MASPDISSPRFSSPRFLSPRFLSNRFSSNRAEPFCIVLAIAFCFCATVSWAGGHDVDNSEMDHSAQGAEMDHSDHDMSGHSSERDDMGRRLHGMKHQVTPEVLDQLRENVRGWEEISAEEVALSMQMMGSNYEWYISDDDLKGRTGVLILLHGFRDRGDKVFKDQLQPYAEIFPTALAMGMSMMMSQHIQLGIDDLTAAGAERIVVVPIVSTEFNTMIRQWQYIFGEYDEAQYASVPKVQTDLEVVFADPIGDDPLVAEILLDYASQISTDPANEVVIIAAHGPSEDDDNVKQLALMDNIAKVVREDGGYAAVKTATLQDDAPPEVRDANVEKLRGMIESATDDGKQVIVVTNLIGAYTIQSKLRKDLNGLDYNFNAKGLVQHESFIEWIGETVRAQM
jgi:sirohydrochlorin cobaltochelatase